MVLLAQPRGAARGRSRDRNVCRTLRCAAVVEGPPLPLTADGALSPLPAVRPRRIAVFVEPSPFSHTSGMKNRFLNMVANLSEQGDEARRRDPPVGTRRSFCFISPPPRLQVIVFTPDRNPPAEYCGAKARAQRGDACAARPPAVRLFPPAADTELPHRLWASPACPSRSTSQTRCCCRWG